MRDLLLVGPAGSDLPEVARLAARALGVEAVSTQEAAAHALGTADVSLAYVTSGAEAFRATEVCLALEAVRALSGGGGVVDLGTSLVQDEAVAAAVRERVAAGTALLVQLTVSLQTAAERLAFTAPRPVFLGNPRAQWTRLAQRATERYDALGARPVSTDERTPDQVAHEIVSLLTEGQA